jgi:hypothetical protein
VPPAAAPGGTVTLPGSLLYIARAVPRGSHYRGVVSVLTLPQGKLTATIRLKGFGTGVCSDTSGNVWVDVGSQAGKNRFEFNLYEYAHGGTTPIANIHVEHAHDLAGDCAVDPTTGNLAVMVGTLNGGLPNAYVYVWAGAREGKPQSFSLPFSPVACAYDDHGNLFADGYIGSTVFFAFGELVKRQHTFLNIALDKLANSFPGGIAWDGKYIDVETGRFARHPEIYRVAVSGSIGHVAGIVHINRLYYAAWYAIEGDAIVATSGHNGDAVGLFSYPEGGKATKIIGPYPLTPRGLAISIGG